MKILSYFAIIIYVVQFSFLENVIKSKFFLAVVGIAAMAMPIPADAGVLIGPGVNNGSFESPVVVDDWTRPAVPGWNPSPGGAGMGYIMLTLSPAATQGNQTFQPMNNAISLPMWFSDPVTPTEGPLITISVDFGYDGAADLGVNSYWRGYIGQKVEVWEYNSATSIYGAAPLITLISHSSNPGSEPGSVGNPGWVTMSDSNVMANPTWDLVVIGETGNLDGTIDWGSGPGCDRSYSHYIDNVVMTCDGSIPILSVTPDNQQVCSLATTGITFDVNNTGTATGMAWTASTIETWLSTSGSGTDAGQFTVDATENTTGSTRVGTVTVSAPGASIDMENVTMTQLGTCNCGDEGAVVGDLTGPLGVPDCKVNLYDLAAMARTWMDCTHPDGC